MSETTEVPWEDRVRADFRTVSALPTVDHTWLNAFACISPTDAFAAEVGRAVIEKIMSAPGRRVALTFNAS